jgi:hypothetical protein
MKFKMLCAAAVASLVGLSGLAEAETTRDCVLEGTVKNRSAGDDRVYVAFHSARPATENADCTIRKREKLQFKQPAGTSLQSARPGTQVEYRYTEDSKEGARWHLREVGKSQ